MHNLAPYLVSILLYCLLASTAVAQPAYIAQKIVATDVKGLQLKLSTTITRRDCNRRRMHVSNTITQDELSRPVYTLKTQISMTKMHCPLAKTITETLAAKPLFLPATTSPFMLTLRIPTGYQATIVEIR